MSTKTRPGAQPESAVNNDGTHQPALRHVLYGIHSHDHEQPFCAICNDGLAVCSICQLAEGELTTECPGPPTDWNFPDTLNAWLADDLGITLEEACYSDIIDYRNGSWVKVTLAENTA